MASPDDEFPLLPALGLYAATIRGDGNCLFNALSDQLYGHPGEHAMIRATVVDFMRQNSTYYKQFVDVHAGGGIRRNPKRKNAGAFSTPVYASNPTAADIDRVFEAHLLTMAKGGVYGDNMEITAFSRAFDVDVKIYQHDFAYMVSNPPDEKARPVCHIAYHTWQHYSSIRNVAGPHTGLPHVNPTALTPEEEQQQRAKAEVAPPKVLAWQIDLVHSSLPYYLDRAQIKRTIEECRGDINRATERLLEVDDRRSPASSAQDSSSVEREPDSDDDALHAPNKKRDRRIHRTIKSSPIGKHTDMKPKGLILKLSSTNDSLESLVQATSKSPVTAILKKEEDPDVVVLDDSDDEDWGTEPLKDGDTSSGSEYLSPKSKPVQLKLNLSGGQGIPVGAVPKSKQKQFGPRRKHMTARAIKDVKKQAQKQAQKERRHALANAKKEGSTPVSSDSPNLSQTTLSFPTISTGIRTLYI